MIIIATQLHLQFGFYRMTRAERGVVEFLTKR